VGSERAWKAVESFFDYTNLYWDFLEFLNPNNKLLCVFFINLLLGPNVSATLLTF